jgi:hypothetical protein
VLICGRNAENNYGSDRCDIHRPSPVVTRIGNSLPPFIAHSNSFAGIDWLGHAAFDNA